MKVISEFRDLKDKKVFLRVDFNAPLENDEIKEKYRIKAHKETIDFLISKGARVGLVAHIKDSFKPIVGEIEEVLEHKLAFEEDILNPKLDSQLTLFENIRKYEGEEINDEKLALSLSKGFDLYVNDAFSVSHREHASVSAITKFLPFYAGFLLQKEVENLYKVLNEPSEGKTIILGGAKISTKIPVIKNFISKAEHILIGGALANTIFKFKGLDVGRSLAEDMEVKDILEETDWDNPKILLPKDIVVSEDPEGVASRPYGAGKTGKSFPEVTPVRDLDDNQMILDIGPETIKQFSDIIRNSKMVIFNGPLGLAEVDIFSVGTKVVLDLMIRSKVFSIIGGGDTLALVERWGLLDKFGYISTGGGAMLEFLAGNKLPGLEALGYYEKNS